MSSIEFDDVTHPVSENYTSAFREYLREFQDYVVYITVSNNVLVDGVRYSYGLLYLEFLDEFDRGKGETSWIGSIMFGTYGLAAPLASVVTDKFGCRASVIFGSLVTFVAFIISQFATSVYYLYFSFGLLGGFGSVLMMLPLNVVIVQYFEKKRSLAMGITMCGSGVGTILFNPLSKFLIDEYKWRGALLIEAALILNVVALAITMRPVPNVSQRKQTGADVATELDTMLPNVAHEQNNVPGTNVKQTINNHTGAMNTVEDLPDSDRTFADSALKCPDGEQKNTANILPNYHITNKTSTKNNNVDCKTKVMVALMKIYHVELLKNTGFLIFMVSIVFFGLSFMVPFTFLPDMAISVGLTREDATWMLTAIGIANVVIRVPAGFLGDRQWVSRLKLYIASTLTAGAAIIVMGLTRSLVPIMVSCIIFGFSVGFALVLLTLVLADLFGDDLIADSYGLLLFASGISELIGTPLAGWVFDWSGNYVVSFVIAGVEYLLGGILLLVVPHLQPGRGGN